jgi:outer membrane protein TolC
MSMAKDTARRMFKAILKDMRKSMAKDTKDTARRMDKNMAKVTARPMDRNMDKNMAKVTARRMGQVMAQGTPARKGTVMAQRAASWRPRPPSHRQRPRPRPPRHGRRHRPRKRSPLMAIMTKREPRLTRPSISQLRPLVAAAVVLALSGCASFSKDGGLDSVSSLTSARTGQPVSFAKASPDASTPDDARATLDELLSKPLSVEGAVRIALLNNPRLKAEFAQLALTEANLVQAGRLPNPSFTFGRLSGGGEVEIERSVMFDVVGLLTLPLRRDLEQRRFEQAKLVAAAEAVRLASDTRKAYFNAVAAAQSAKYADQVRLSAEAAAQLARNMAKVGNLSSLDQAREQAFHAEATAQLARARHRATATREALTRLLGLWGDRTAYSLPDRLPDLPAEALAPQQAEATAMTQRLDILMVRRDAEATASALGLSRATGFINVLHAGYANASKSGEPRENGYEIELELPIFDWGRARVARAEAIYMQSVHRAADAAIRARSEVREAYSAYRTSYDLARHYRDEVVPLQKKISEETLLRYNGMLISVFELLADARAQVTSVNAAIEAQRDFWIAHADLHNALSGSGGASTALQGGAATAAAPQPQH